MEKKKEFIINTVYIAIICGLVYICINYLLGLLLPFIIGFIFAYLAMKMCKRFFKDDRRSFRFLALLLIYIFIASLVSIIVALGVNKIGDFIKSLPNFYKNILEPYISNLESSLSAIGDNLPDVIDNSLSQATDSLFDGIKSILSSLASNIVNFTTSFIISAPETIVTVIVTIITSFYFVADYELIAKTFTDSLSEKALSFFYEIKDFIENTLLKILTAYLGIMGITFVELFIGLTLMGIGNTAMWALVISFLDILPVLGVGTVLIPWGLSSIITGRFGLGIGLLLLYVVIFIIRNIIEPRFVGTNLGLHPLLTLASMIIGVRLFGAIGMFGFPLALSFYMNRRKLNTKPQKKFKTNKNKSNK